MLIKAGSHSRLSDFERCRYAARLKYVDKVPEPPRAKLPDGKEYPDERGNRVHKQIEQYIKGAPSAVLTVEMRHFEAEIQAARAAYIKGLAEAEVTWNFDENWQPLGDPFANPAAVDWSLFNRIKFRIKTDLWILLNEERTRGLVVDFKTGKKFGNEVKHGEQMELFGIGAFMRYPLLEQVTTELYYLDINDMSSMVFTQGDALKRLKLWDDRNKTMLVCMDFIPSPNINACKWCPYRQDRSGHCKVGVMS